LEWGKCRFTILSTSLQCPVLTAPSPAPSFSVGTSGYDGCTEDPAITSAFAADPAGARAGAALLCPGPHAPAVPATTCAPSGNRWR
jgi:hypothetical protein